MSFPTTTYTDNESAASGFVSNAAQQGLSLNGLNPVAQLQSAVANLLLDEPSGTVDLTTDVTGILPGANGGTGVANTGKTLTLAGNLATAGAFAITLTATGTTGVTLPTTGTLVTTAVTTLSSLATVSATLGFGGTTSAFPMLKRSSTALQARLADDSTYAPFAAASYAVGATAGASGGPFTTISGITVVNGIVTAITGS